MQPLAIGCIHAVQEVARLPFQRAEGVRASLQPFRHQLRKLIIKIIRCGPLLPIVISWDAALRPIIFRHKPKI